MKLDTLIFGRDTHQHMHMIRHEMPFDDFNAFIFA